ncbi:MAG: peptide chain release factor 1 [Actinomycetaceae bacterium]|nr:peptide chain release factor 1 [Actinomycetaceae bacterium]
MSTSLSLDSLDGLLAEYQDVQAQLSDPEVHSTPGKARRLGRRYAELGRIHAAAQAYRQASEDLDAGREMAAEDPEFGEELPAMEQAAIDALATLQGVLAPRDPNDASDVIMEIKAGEGGEESALFAADLMRMYMRYAETKGWSVQVLGSMDSDLGGIKDAQIVVKAKGDVAPEDGVWAHLKYEGGVHRVQRVPVTESQGRIHTSAAGVIVMPDIEEDEEVVIEANDIKVDVFRSSGPGGQSVNTTDSAVRITHIPTGIVVSMQNEKSQLQNREAGMRVLRARLAAAQAEKREAEAAEARQSQIRTVDRSERIRTYNFPENRIADHRTGYKAYNLDHVMNGELGPVIDSAIQADEKARLAAAVGQD